MTKLEKELRDSHSNQIKGVKGELQKVRDSDELRSHVLIALVSAADPAKAYFNAI